MRLLPNPKPPGRCGARRPSAWGTVVLSLALVAAAWGADRRPVLAAAEAALLDEVQRRAVLYFVEQTDAESGLTLDRARLDGSGGGQERAPSSVAATGFALTAWCIAAERGWLTQAEARRRVRQTLRTLAERHAQERGWFYHFVDAADGRRVWRSEASSTAGP